MREASSSYPQKNKTDTHERETEQGKITESLRYSNKLPLQQSGSLGTNHLHPCAVHSAGEPTPPSLRPGLVSPGTIYRSTVSGGDCVTNARPLSTRGADEVFSTRYPL